MSRFLRLLGESNKAQALLDACTHLRHDESDVRFFDVAPQSFTVIPGKPFAYWVGDSVRNKFVEFLPLSSKLHLGKGPDTGDDFRFLRLNWEVNTDPGFWVNHPKGGAFSRFYSDVHLVINWREKGRLVALVGNMRNPTYMYRPGITWSRRTSSKLSLRAMPAGCVFADKGPAGFIENDDLCELMALLAIANSKPFRMLVELQLAAADAAARSYEVGIIQNTPFPALSAKQQQQFEMLSRRAWSLKRTADSTTETSHAFLLPAALRARAGNFDSPAIELELEQIKNKIDTLAYDLYGFAEVDREVVDVPVEDSKNMASDEDDEDVEVGTTSKDSLLSWAVGVVFGRFDLRLATGEREALPEPDPFDPLPIRSPGMLSDGDEPFHANEGILVVDQGNQNDLAHLIEEVLGRIDMPVPDDVRRWLQEDFFAFHLQRFSKSRRKAPIYWPLATASGSYSLWLYYPSLSSQTLYTAINDFVEPKLKQVGDDVAALRNKGAARSRDDEKQFESLHAFELELIELRDTLLKVAQGYQPNHDDGVQITAAPLWPLFRHKPWQKILKDTWAKLEKGDYDWAQLAMNYWPERVRVKCQTDKSLAIAHDLEALYVESKGTPKKAREGGTK